MDEKVDAPGKKFSISMALIMAILGTAVIAASFFMPWWVRIENTVGPLQTIYLYKSARIWPFEIEEYMWAVRDPRLKMALLYPFMLVAASFLLAITSMFLRNRTTTGGVTALLSGAASTASHFVFRNLFEGYMETIGETVSGGMGWLHWGYGLGSKLSLAAAVLMAAAGALQLFKTEHFELEFVLEKETEGS